jgi:hypothetical protein
MGTMISRRRWVSLSLGLLLVISLGVFHLWRRPALSPDERRLLGSWTAPDPDPRSGWVTPKGPVAHPWLVWEFHRNRTFYVWVAEAGDPSIRIPHKEGRWSAEGGKLALQGFGGWGDALREIRENVRIRLGGSYLGRGGDIGHSIRFPDDDALEMTLANGKTIAWKRRR